MINITPKKFDNIFIYGIQPVKELLRSSHPIENLTIAHELELRTKKQLIGMTQKKQIKIKYIPKQQMQRLTGPVVHQGVAAELKRYHYVSEKTLFVNIKKTDKPIILILDQIQDPHNLGAIIRTAEIAGIHAVVIPEKGSAQVNSTVAKTSAGAVFHIPIHQTPNLNVFLEKLKETDIHIAAAEAGKRNNIYEIKFPERLAIMIGSEGKGVRKNLLKYADLKISIPQFGKVRSLNASVSSAIILYEIVRQKYFTNENEMFSTNI